MKNFVYIKRKIEDDILAYLDKREILAIIGPRQAGKTTVLKKIQANLEKSIFVCFEDREELELFEQDIKSFAKKYLGFHYLFIDEFQYATHGGKNLKYLYDTYPQLKIIISGSSAIDLTIKALKFLVGRVLIFNLNQLTFGEYLSFKAPKIFPLWEKLEHDYGVFSLTDSISDLKISEPLNLEFNNLLSDFIRFGAYPRVVSAETEEEKIMILKNIFNTYFLREVKDVLGLADDFKLSKLIKGLALQIGQLVEYNELSQLSEYEYGHLKTALNLLEKTFICRSIRPYFKNKRKEIVKNPKIYFFDTGLRNYIINNFNNLDSRSDKGALMENFIFAELLKKDINFNFWRTKAKQEVDFVFLGDGENITAVEIKSSLTSLKISAGLKSFINEYQPKRAYLLNSQIVGRLEIEKTKIFFLPHWLI